MNATPHQAIIAVTYRCNARCGMCDIWRKDVVDEVEPSLYYHLPTSLKEINLTGGEPFLRGDLDTIVQVMLERVPGVRIIISSNGLLPERIAKIAPRLRELSPRLGVRISVDGDRATHDRVRGIDGAYDKAWESLDALRAAGITDLGIGFTMMRGNEEQMLPLFEKATAQRLQFTSTIVHSSPIFFGEQDTSAPDPEKAAAAYEKLRRRQLQSWRPKDWFRAYFTAGVRDMARGEHRPIVCEGGTSFFYLDPYGMVYPCHIKDWPLGYLEEGYDRLIARGGQVLARVRSCGENCWMTCTVGPMMRQDLAGVGARVGLDRLRALFRWY
jgi:MoaA/NifB/PqqE/SkfB family radical SAM enzyme